MAKVSLKTITEEQRQSAFEKGISLTTIRNRLSRGWSAEDAISEVTKPKGGKNDSSKLVNREDKVQVDEFSTASWFAGPGQMVKCPVEGCTHSGLVITKVHCRNEHGMEREDVSKVYGMPEVLQMNLNKVRKEQSFFVGHSLK